MPGSPHPAGNPRIDDALKVNVYADNTFTLYINGELVATDPIKFVPAQRGLGGVPSDLPDDDRGTGRRQCGPR